jgi:hypothetical protein
VPQEKRRALPIYGQGVTGLSWKIFHAREKILPSFLKKIAGGEVVPGIIMGSSYSNILLKLNERDEVQRLPGWQGDVYLSCEIVEKVQQA